MHQNHRKCKHFGSCSAGRSRHRLQGGVPRIPLPDDRIRIDGAVDLRRGDEGVVPRRLSERYRHQLPPEVDLLASSPSGVRLVFRTDSPTVEVELRTMRFQLGTDGARPAIVDVVVDGHLIASEPSHVGSLLVIDPVDPTNITIEPGPPATWTVEDGRADLRTFEIWLPSAATVEAISIGIADGAALEAPPASTRLRWVHHGSSISHCMEAHGPAQSWPAVAARLAGVDLTNLGLAGQCHLDQFTARTIRDLPADRISLKCGINVVNGDTLRLRTFAPALHGFLDTIRDGHPDTPILVVSPIICPTAEDRPGPTVPQADGTYRAVGTEESRAAGALTLRQIRRIVAEVVAVRVAAGDEHLFHLDGLQLFDEHDLADLPDALHPNGDGYVRMGERFAALAFSPEGPLA
jgi:hypothetical protein